MLKRKDMHRTEWKNIQEKEYRHTVFFFNDQKAVASVLRMKKVSAPVTVCRGEKKAISIANENDLWLQIAVENSPVWITAMYDSTHLLQQVYFDITNGNDLSNLENPTFEDLFFDVVLDAEGDVDVRDEEELEAAYVSGVITREQYHRANEAGKQLCAYLHRQKQELLDFCMDKLAELE